MVNHTFYYLRNLVRPYVKKQNIAMNKSISAVVQLVVTLRFLDAVMSISSFRAQSHPRLLEIPFQKPVE